MKRRSIVGWLGAAATNLPLHAQALGAPVLTISGQLSRPNQGPDAVFDMAMISALPQRSMTLATPWFSQPRKFTGPLVREVLAAAGAQGARVLAVALDDFRADIPMADVQRYDVVLACLLDDKPMAVRDKGPLFIMYPFDAQPQLRTTTYFSRCVWQLKQLIVS